MLIHVYIYIYTSVLFIYSLQIFGYDYLWYNCSIVIIFYFPFISLFYSFVCSSHLCILSYMLVPYGAFFIIKNLNLNLYRCLLPLLSKWIMKKTWKMLVMQQMMTLLYEPKIESSCVV